MPKKSSFSRIEMIAEFIFFGVLLGVLNARRQSSGSVLPLQTAVPYRFWINLFILLQLLFILIKASVMRWTPILVVVNIVLNLFFVLLLFLVQEAIWFPEAFTRPVTLLLMVLSIYDSGESVYLLNRLKKHQDENPNS